MLLFGTIYPPINLYRATLVDYICTSSMKMMAGLLALASSKRLLTNRSLSPSHLLTRSDEEMEKNVESASVATALAR